LNFRYFRDRVLNNIFITHPSRQALTLLADVIYSILMTELHIKPITTDDEYLAARDLTARVFCGHDPEAYEPGPASTMPGIASAWSRAG